MAWCPCRGPLSQPFTSAVHLQSLLRPWHEALCLTLAQYKFYCETEQYHLDENTKVMHVLIHLQPKRERLVNTGSIPCATCLPSAFNTFFWTLTMNVDFRRNHKQAINSSYTLQIMSDSMWADCSNNISFRLLENCVHFHHPHTVHKCLAISVTYGA